MKYRPLATEKATLLNPRGDIQTMQPDALARRRLKLYRQFGVVPRGRTLDVGAPNWIGKLLAPSAVNTFCDLDYVLVATPSGGFDTILCFEVIEHLGNPLKLLENMFRAMNERGTIYFSTPLLPFISIYSSPRHLTEWKLDRLEYMIDKAGYRIMKKAIRRTMPISTAWRGFRPLLRFLLCRTVIFELRKR
jgi:SAM-dependent methyltransferase